jgi:hypothetical protein
VLEEVIPPPATPSEEVPAEVLPPEAGSEPTPPPEESSSAPILGHEPPAAIASAEGSKSTLPAQPTAAGASSAGTEPLPVAPPTAGGPPAPKVGVLGETWSAAAGSAVALSSASPRKSPAQQARALNCALSALAGPSTVGCGDALIMPSALLSAPMLTVTVPMVAQAVWTVSTRTGRSSSEGDIDAAGGSRPVSPTPGPTPGGAAGGTATGGSGIAVSAFLTLAGLLLLAAPRALRRLRLSSSPWRTAFFVLIPERPG